jgi:hypothetical protein
LKTNAGGLALLAGLFGGVLAAGGCSPAAIRPQAFADPAVPCPAGLISWRLHVVDQRPEREGGEKMIASIREGIQTSFPGCRWSPASDDPDAGTPTITITVFRLGVSEHNRYQDAAAEWNVTATSTTGSTMTQFDANEEDSRPAYSGADEEALNEAFRRALQRTVKGLAQIQRLGSARRPSPPGSARPREGTLLSLGTSAPPATGPAVNR